MRWRGSGRRPPPVKKSVGLEEDGSSYFRINRRRRGPLTLSSHRVIWSVRTEKTPREGPKTEKTNGRGEVEETRVKERVEEWETGDEEEKPRREPT